MTYRIGADENGLGSRLGPLVVTAVLARADERGLRALGRRLPKSVRGELDDSKRLVSHTDARLGEAWARVLAGGEPRTPAELFSSISLEGVQKLGEPCPHEARAQCWDDGGETFEAEPELVEKVASHRALLRERGIEFVALRSSVVCTERLNHARKGGKNRFVSDLHAMEALVLELRRLAGENVTAVCGKVGGIGEYSRYFGPLGGWLHSILGEAHAKSAYHFPTVGELRFVRDADASDPLVMLSSLVGKWVRELFMGRIARHYPATAEEQRPSGYHDPVTARFVKKNALLRKKRGIPDRCFERDRDPLEPYVREVCAEPAPGERAP
jgi:ribonuclease HII